MFSREKTLYWACNDKCAFYISEVYKNYNLWSCQKVCETFVYLLDNIFNKFGNKFYRQIIDIPTGTNCAPLVADLFLFCYVKDLMQYLLPENQADIIEAFNSTSKTLMIYQILIAFTLNKWLTGYTLPNFNKIKLILPIMKRRFWIWTYPFLRAQFPLKVMINGIILI